MPAIASGKQQPDGSLAAVGGECAGAVACFPEGGQLARADAAQPQQLDETQLAETLALLRSRPLLADEMVKQATKVPALAAILLTELQQQNIFHPILKKVQSLIKTRAARMIREVEKAGLRRYLARYNQQPPDRVPGSRSITCGLKFDPNRAQFAILRWTRLAG